MKNVIRIMIVGVLFMWSAIAMAQCPPPNGPGGLSYQFTTQTEIDEFLADYPNCTELAEDKDLDIFNEEGTSDPITNLNGFTNLTSVHAIEIRQTNLTDLSGFDSLTEVRRKLQIYENPMLESLNGIESLTALGTAEVFNIFSISDNPVLTDITALQNVTQGTINSISINSNALLTSLEGIDNINFGADLGTWGFSISDNPNLSICAVESICNYISGGGSASISGNAPGCEDLNEVTTNCQIAFPNCPENDVLLTTQAEVDQFLVDYPNCAVIPGTLIIDDAGTDPIVNLDGLQNIETIYGLAIKNTTLADFSGLNALEVIDGTIEVDNISESDITFLNGLEEIGGGIILSNNTALTDLNGFSTLTHIDGPIEVTNNDALTTLSGLDNLVANTITNLIIEDNDNLSLCNMDAICIYLDNGFPATISSNDTGCDTVAQVEGTCDTAECPPGDVEFLTQAELDYFALQYPNCTQITGNVTIGDLPNDISDLQAFQNITAIQGYLDISSTQITSFDGLHNLESINGNWLAISRNNNLTNFQGFDSLESVTGTLIVSLNDNLETLTGIETLTTLNSLHVQNNETLLNVDGLDNIGDMITTNPTRPASINITSNDSLEHIDALSGVTFANSRISIQQNPALESLSGLQNLTTTGIPNPSPTDPLGSVRIQGNPLSTLGLESLEKVYGFFYLSSQSLVNLDDLSSLTEVWSLSLNANESLENIEGLSNLTQVFKPGFPVTDFEIDYNPNLESLHGLENVSKAGTLRISGNNALTSLEGLQLEELGGGVLIQNNQSLTNLSGLENLTATATHPAEFPRNFLIWDNESLTSLEALQNLETINTSIIAIAGNTQLASLSGLDNIDPNSIAFLELVSSQSLSTCDIPSICEYLETAPASDVTISGNAEGCNTIAEVEDACEALGVEDVSLYNSIAIHPNPMQDNVTITTSNGIVIEQVTLYDVSGKAVYTHSGDKNTLNVSSMSKGIYFIVVNTNKGVYQQKLVK